MRSEVLTELDKNQDLYLFLREYPIWYRTLNRDPYTYKEFIDFYKVKRRKRMVDKVEDAMDMINMLSMVMEEM